MPTNMLRCPLLKRRPVKCLGLAVALLVIGGSLCFSQEPARRRQNVAPDAQFERWDRNGDGFLTRDELPERLRGNFGRVDRDGDGKITPAEHAAVRRRGNTGRGPRVPEGTEVLKDISYVENGHERHKLDLYIPADASGKLPLVVWIHGGGWRNGSKDGCPATVLLEDGFVVASINYRLSGHAPFPAQIEDCKAAIRWLRAHADQHHIDPDRIGVWGSSAGGHLVALLGTSGDVAALEGSLGLTGVSSRVQAVCDYFGPTDLLSMQRQSQGRSPIDHDAPNSPESLLLGGTLQEHPEAARRASPLTYISADDPPFLIVHGDQDFLVPLPQSQMLEKQLQDAGVEAELIVVPGAGHGQFRDPKIVEQVRDFFQKTLDHQPASQ